MNRKIETHAMNWQKKMFWTLVVFTLGSMVVTLIGEAFKTHLIWYLRFADFVDLLVVAPLYLVTLLLFHELFIQGNASRGLRWAFLVLRWLWSLFHGPDRVRLTRISADPAQVRARLVHFVERAEGLTR